MEGSGGLVGLVTLMTLSPYTGMHGRLLVLVGSPINEALEQHLEGSGRHLKKALEDTFGRLQKTPVEGPGRPLEGSRRNLGSLWRTLETRVYKGYTREPRL